MEAFVQNERTIYWSRVRMAMLYKSETWCLRENEIVLLNQTEKAMT